VVRSGRERARFARLVAVALAIAFGLTGVQAEQPAAESLHQQAMTRLSHGDPDGAAVLFDRALAVAAPPSPGLLYHAAYAAYRRGEAAAARRLARRALAQAPDDPRPRALLGLLEVEQGRLTEAEETLRALLLRHPDDLLGSAYLGHCLALRGQFTAARGHLERAIARTRATAAARAPPGSRAPAVDDPALQSELAASQLLASLGFVYLRLENYTAAVDVLRQALAADPSLATARFHLGLAWFSLGHVREAADAFAQVLRADPDDARARYHLALALIKQGHRQQGADELAKVIAAGRPEDVVTMSRQLLDEANSPE
jgi:tetratricopeptide (TPR) repeat protein